MTRTLAHSPEHILSTFLGDLCAGAPATSEGLTLYPLIARDPPGAPCGATLDEALDSGGFRICEVNEAGSVNHLAVENLLAVPVFVMAGEIVRGAKQDRTAQSDMLVPPGSGRIVIDCFCTERGRWSRRSTFFSGSESPLPSSIRSASKRRRDQATVWSSIDSYCAKLSFVSETGAAAEAFEAPAVRRDLEVIESGLAHVPEHVAGMVGVIALFGERVIAIDTFGDPALLRKLYPKLLRSYTADVLQEDCRGETSPDRAIAALRKASAAPWVGGRTQGIGTRLDLSEGDMHGSALVHGGQVVHADLFLALVR